MEESFERFIEPDQSLDEWFNNLNIYSDIGFYPHDGLEETQPIVTINWLRYGF